jgi:uncharacterized protein (TIGR03790 family)
MRAWHRESCRVKIRPVKFLLSLFLTGSLIHAQEPSPATPFDYSRYPQATVVLYNSAVPASAELAQYYAAQRGIPKANLVGVKASSAEIVTREVYENEIEKPLRAAFDQRKWWETARVGKEGLLATKTTMRVIAIMQGIPLGIGEKSHGKDPKTGQEILPGPGQSNAASVDSELTLLGALEHSINGFVPNPLFNTRKPFFESGLTPVFLTGRIDGPDKATARRLIDDALTTEKEGLYGKAYIDLARKTDAGYKQGEDALIQSARILETQGVPVVMDTWAPTFVQNFPLHDCGYYLGWYTGHADGPFLNPAFRFRRGAVACHIHSFSAATLRSPDKNWCGPLVAKGACATLGNVFEPYLPLCASLEIFSERLLAGASLAEAAWASSRGLSWMSVVLGDPLYRPFAAPPGGGDKKFAPDYKALRLAMKSWGRDDQKAERMKNLERAAAALKSPAIYEFMALHAQAGDAKAFPAAKPWLELAEQHTTQAADKSLIVFLKADALRRDGDHRAASKLLSEFADKVSSAPEAAAARALVQQIKDTK